MNRFDLEFEADLPQMRLKNGSVLSWFVRKSEVQSSAAAALRWIRPLFTHNKST